MNRQRLIYLLAVSIGLGASEVARAQEDSAAELKARIERLEKQNEQLLQYLQKMQPPATNPVAGVPAAIGAPPASQGATLGAPMGKDDVKKIVGDYLTEKENQKKADDAAKKKQADEDGYRVGSSLNMSASWQNGLVLDTPNKDFTMHIGGWLQYDNVFYNQSPSMQIAPGARPGPKQGVASGVAAGGVGDLQDGTYFRRIRLMTDGVFWECYEYTLILALENNQFSTIGVDEFWVGAKDIPLIGTARIGHVKNAIGLEADMTGSSRTMTFMERSSYSESIELNQNFVTGLWLGNNYFDKRATSTFTLFRADQASSTGAFFGDGQYGMQGRLTALPYYENDGRCLVHVGLSGGWRANSNNIATSPFRTIQIRARDELRDDDPAGSPGGGQAIPNANSNRMIDTGAISANSDWLCGLELLCITGPLSVQAEYGYNFVEDAVGIAPAGLAFNPKLTSPQNYAFNGGYVQVAYTLTGENRAYDKRLGRLDSMYFGKNGPYNNAWWVRGDDGRMNFNCGAVEVAGRYSYVNLNDGVGLNRIQGGVMNGYSFGLNWYLNANLKFQFDYVIDQRSDVAVGTIPGQVTGFGTRMQFNY